MVATRKKTIVKRSTDKLPVKREKTPLKPGKDRNIMSRANKDAGYQYILELKEKLKTYEAVAAHLNKEGWTAVNGSPLNQPNLSRFMAKQGFYVYEPRSNAQTFDSDSIEAGITKILQAEFSTSERLTLIKALIDSKIKDSDKNR